MQNGSDIINTESKNDEVIDEYIEQNSCSSLDCTGLIPNAVQNSGEFQSYENLYPFLPPKIKTKKTYKKVNKK